MELSEQGIQMDLEVQERMRVEALRQAVEARTMSSGPDDIVNQAECFYAFLVSEHG